MLGRVLGLGLVAALVAVGLQDPPQGPEDWLARYSALEADIGDSTYTRTDSATLAWNESYVLRSYVEVYRKTGNTYWLDKLVKHADTIIGNADDIDHDGFLGWASPAYSPMEVANPGLDEADPDDTTKPKMWSRSGDTGTHIYRTTERAPTARNTHAVRLVSDSLHVKKLTQAMSFVEPGTKYMLRGWGKKSGDAVGRAVLRDRSDLFSEVCALTFTETVWTHKEVVCTLPAGHTFEVSLEHADHRRSGSADFDDIRLSGIFPYAAHDGMIGTPIAEFIRLVASTPKLQPEYQAKADGYFSFLTQHIAARWEHSAYLGNCWNELPNGEGTYEQPHDLDTFELGPEIDLPYNEMLSFVQMLAVLHSVRPDPIYLDRVQRAGLWVKNILVRSGDTYVWRHGPQSTPAFEDIIHANGDVTAFMELYEQGIVFTTRDMERLASTFTDNLWNRSMRTPMLAWEVDGASPEAGDYHVHNWLQLTEFNPRVGRVVAAMYEHQDATSRPQLLAMARMMD